MRVGDRKRRARHGREGSQCGQAEETVGRDGVAGRRPQSGVGGAGRVGGKEWGTIEREGSAYRRAVSSLARSERAYSKSAEVGDERARARRRKWRRKKKGGKCAAPVMS